MINNIYINKKHVFKFSLLAMALFQVPLSATELGPTGTLSGPTPKVVGHKPVAINITLSPTEPKATDTVTVDYLYDDADGDGESGTSITWLLNGTPISGATSKSVTLPSDAAGKSLQVSITPRSVAGADPQVGNTVSSSIITIKPVGLPPPPTPYPVTGTWTFANNYCKTRIPAARLPTRAELQNIFVTYTGGTIGTVNYQMCTKYYWPLASQCGGINGRYWTSEEIAPGDGSYYNVNMQTGSYTFNSASLEIQFVCVAGS